MPESHITPEIALKFPKPTENFLCPPDLMQNIKFLEFKIRETESNKILFQINRPSTLGDSTPVSSTERLTTSNCDPVPDVPSTKVLDAADLSPDEQSEGRTVHYQFDADFLTYRTIGTTLVFAVGDEEVKNFRMIERHYYKTKLLKSYDFTFGFCIPNSVNTWESLYTVPEVDEKLVQEMIQNPGKTVSDSFYFIDNNLVMHSKATYSFIPKPGKTKNGRKP